MTAELPANKMSVGLGRIINDSAGSTVARKNFGTLSNPNLIITNQGVYINGEGKISLRLSGRGIAVNESAQLDLVTSDLGITINEAGEISLLVTNEGITIDSDGYLALMVSEDGITIDGNGELAAKVSGTGIELDGSGNISAKLKANSGLAQSASGLEVLVSNTGIELNGSGQVSAKLKALSGLAQTSSGLEVLVSNTGIWLDGSGNVAARLENLKGLSQSSLGLAVAVSGTGIEFNGSGQVSAKLKALSGLSQTGSGLEVIVSNTGIWLDGSGLVAARLNAAGALSQSGSGLAVEVSGTGIEISANKVSAKLKSTGAIAQTASGLEVNVSGTGIEINGSNQVAAKLKASSGIAQTASGLEVLVSGTGIEFSAGAVSAKLKSGGGLAQTASGLEFTFADVVGYVRGSTNWVGYGTALVTGASLTITDIWGHHHAEATLGSGSTAVNQYGYYCANLTVGTTLRVAFGAAMTSGTNKWNCYMSGSAQNYFAGNVGIGTASIGGVALNVVKTTEQVRIGYDGSNYLGFTVDASGNAALQTTGTTGIHLNVTGGNVGIGTNSTSAKLHVIKTTEQTRIGYDTSNYIKTTVDSSGNATLQPVGTNADVRIVTTGDGGLMINGGYPIQKVMAATGTSLTFNLDGTGQYIDVAVTGILIGDHVLVTPYGDPAGAILSWSGHVVTDGYGRIRVITQNVGGTDTRDWRITAFRYPATP